MGRFVFKVMSHILKSLLSSNMQRLQIQEVLPKAGLVYSERGNLTEVLCKPKIMPIKSATLLRIEEIEKQARAVARPATGNLLGGETYRPTTTSRK